MNQLQIFILQCNRCLTYFNLKKEKKNTFWGCQQESVSYDCNGWIPVDSKIYHPSPSLKFFGTHPSIFSSYGWDGALGLFFSVMSHPWLVWRIHGWTNGPSHPVSEKGGLYADIWGTVFCFALDWLNASTLNLKLMPTKERKDGEKYICDDIIMHHSD